MALNGDMKTSKDNHTIRSQQQNHENSDPKSPKRRRDADQRILDQFWVICDPNPFKRNKSLKLIIEILIKQNESNHSNDLMYCLERVIRGMASARQFARHGFCVLLTQILSVFESKVSLDLVFQLSEKHLGRMDELSNHDSVIGWSLVMASVLKSQRLSTEEDEKIFGKCFAVLYTLGMNKQYIELLVCQLFTHFMEFIDENVLFEKIAFNQIYDDLKTENKYKPFFVFICFSILERFPKWSKTKNLKFIVQTDDIPRLIQIIKESTAYHPSVHPFNRQVIRYFINGKEFPKFWNQCVDNILFTPNQVEKGFLGFELIKISLQYIKTSENINAVLSPSFLRLFIQSLSVKTHPLHSASQQLCDFFIEYIKSMDNSNLQLEFVNSFTKEPGSLLFDDISKSKFFSNLLKNLSITSINEWTNRLKTLFLTTNKVDSNDILRIRCIQQISSVCKSVSSEEGSDILWSNIKFVFFHSYFNVKQQSEGIDQMLRTPSVEITENLRHSLRDGFRSICNHSLSSGSKISKEKLSHESETLSAMVQFISDLVSNENIEFLTNSNFLESFNTINEKVVHLKKKLKSNPSNENKIKIFILLYSILAIQLFEEYEEIDSILGDLNECVKRAISNSKPKHLDSSPVWSDVLTDLILSLLTTSSKLTKTVLFSSFKHICCDITNTGIKSLIDAINPSNDNKLFGPNEDSDEEEGEENDVEEEIQDLDKSESESDSDSEDENQNVEIDEKFRNDVINSLGPAAHNDDDEESVYLSDSEMFQIDENLAAVFKTKFADKKEFIEKRNSIIAFRLRCLELIQIVLSHKDVDLDKVFIFIEPIVSVAKSSSLPSKQNPLSEKSIQLIQQITKIRDICDNSLEVKDFNHILDHLLTVLSKTNPSGLQKALIALIIWNISLGKKLFPKEDWFLSAIKNALKLYFEKSNCQTPPIFFKNLINVHNEIGFKLFDLFFEYAFKEEIRPFSKTIALEVILLLCKIKNQKTNAIQISEQQLIEIREKSVKALNTELSVEVLRAQYVSELLRVFSIADKHLKDLNSKQKISDEDFEELSSKLKSLSKKQRNRINVKEIIKKITSNTQ